MVIVVDGLPVLFQLGIGPASPVIALAFPKPCFDMFDGDRVKPDGFLVLANVEILPPFIEKMSSTCCGPRESHGYGVHTVPGVLRGKAFTEEYVTQMSSAVVALNLDPMAVWVR